MRPLLAATAVVALLAGCGGGGGSDVGTDTTTGKDGRRFHYSAALRQSYMQACTNGGVVKKSVCSCTLDKLSSSVSSADFRRMQISGSIPPRVRAAIRRAANDCRNA